MDTFKNWIARIEAELCCSSLLLVPHVGPLLRALCVIAALVGLGGCAPAVDAAGDHDLVTDTRR